MKTKASMKFGRKVRKLLAVMVAVMLVVAAVPLALFATAADPTEPVVGNVDIAGDILFSNVNYDAAYKENGSILINGTDGGTPTFAGVKVAEGGKFIISAKFTFEGSIGRNYTTDGSYTTTNDLIGIQIGTHNHDSHPNCGLYVGVRAGHNNIYIMNQCGQVHGGTVKTGVPVQASKEMTLTYEYDTSTGYVTVWINGEYAGKSAKDLRTLTNFNFATGFTATGLGKHLVDPSDPSKGLADNKVTISDVHIFGDVSVDTSVIVPAMPAGNKNYMPYLRPIMIRGSNKFECDFDKDTGKADLTFSGNNMGEMYFKGTEFTSDDAIVYGFDVKKNVNYQDKGWIGMRVIVQRDSSNNLYMVYLMDKTVCVYYADASSQNIHPLSSSVTVPEVKSNGEFRFDVLSTKDYITVYINGVAVIKECPKAIKPDKNATEKVPFVMDGNNVGMHVESAPGVDDLSFELENMTLYCVEPKEFVEPLGIPTIPAFSGTNYANYCTMKNSGATYSNFYNDSIMDTSGNYTFEDLKYDYDKLDVTVSAKFKILKRTEKTAEQGGGEAEWGGPRFYLANCDGSNFQIAFMRDSVAFLQDGVGPQDTKGASSPTPIKTGEEYKIAYQYSIKTNTLNVWVNDVCIFERIVIADFVGFEKNFDIKLGVQYEYASVQLTDLKVYGSGIESNLSEYAQALKQNPLFTSLKIPVTPTGNLNLFQHIVDADTTNGGVSYYWKDGTFSNLFSDESGFIRFLDATRKRNINGITNSTTFKLTFDYKINTTQEGAASAGGEFEYRRFRNPTNSNNFGMSLGLYTDGVVLKRYSEGSVAATHKSSKTLELGKTYSVTILSAPDWTKVWVDGELLLIVSEHPEFPVDLSYSPLNATTELSNFTLYDAYENTSLVIREPVEVEKNPAGDTITAAKDVDIPLVSASFSIFVAIAGLVAVLSIAGVVIVTVVFIKKKKAAK